MHNLRHSCCCFCRVVIDPTQYFVSALRVCLHVVVRDVPDYTRVPFLRPNFFPFHLSCACSTGCIDFIFCFYDIGFVGEQAAVAIRRNHYSDTMKPLEPNSINILNNGRLTP